MKNPNKLPQTVPSWSTREEILTNVDFYCPSHNYPFEATILLIKAYNQLVLASSIHMCNTNSIA
jgi:hypothetical protein